MNSTQSIPRVHFASSGNNHCPTPESFVVPHGRRKTLLLPCEPTISPPSQESCFCVTACVFVKPPSTNFLEWITNCPDMEHFKWSDVFFWNISQNKGELPYTLNRLLIKKFREYTKTFLHFVADNTRLYLHSYTSTSEQFITLLIQFSVEDGVLRIPVLWYLYWQSHYMNLFVINLSSF